MIQSKNNLALIEAYTAGYRITKDGEIISKSGLKIKGYYNDRGYKCFSIRLSGVSRSVFVHRLQAFQKYSDKIFFKEYEVRHLDGNKINNSHDNISIGTHSDNMMDKSEDERKKSAHIATSYVRKHNKNEIRDFYNKSKSYKKTMDHYKISSKGTLHFILNK